MRAVGVNRRIKVLVVDDSIVFREVIARGISCNPNIQVVATASDPFQARDMIIKYEPDVMTCDVEMPKMNGIEFIRRLLPQYPIPVIMVSGVSNIVFDAMDTGAVDFISKPNINSAINLETFINDLIDKIITVSSAKVKVSNKVTVLDNKVGSARENYKNKLVAIGASTGGTEAIFNVLKRLNPNMPGIVITQHIPPTFSAMFAERLNNQTDFNVKEAKNGDVLDYGTVLIAPGDQHMKIKKFGSYYKVECYHGEKVSGHCPSVDVLFESVGKEVGENAIGIILTGMGYDGAKGLLNMKRRGSKTIGQDEKSSVVYGMPKAAFDIGAVDIQVSLEKIPSTICELLR
jgi:two-component system chemotaxis response regulator CheB